jgi:hypothetical protein
MTTRKIQIRQPGTNAIVGTCPGPAEAGTCPFADATGVVPCAGFLIEPAGADHQHWPLPIPAGYRHCDVPWNERAVASLRKAENCRRQWQTGLRNRRTRVRRQAAGRDPRYRDMSPRDLDLTALWYWRLSTTAQGLRRGEKRAQEEAETYLAFTEHRRNSAREGRLAEWR